jgi:polyisoprenoid-binding protein YceI
MHSVPTAGAVPGYPAGTWKADPGRSEIAFSVRLLLLGKARGRFTGFEATIVTGEDPMDSSVTATIDLASVDTGNARRDDHLRSAYFQVENHPTMTYRSTGIRQADDGWGIDGELTLHGVTRSVPVTVEANGFVPGPRSGKRIRFSATAQVDRSDFGIGRAILLDGGGVGIGDKVAISLEIEAVLQK